MENIEGKQPKTGTAARVLPAAAAVAAGALILFAFNPLRAGWFPPCPFHFLTGLYCPGCGSLRALHLLLHGQIAGAFRMNPLLLLSLPVIAAAYLRRLWTYQTWLPWAIVVVVVLYGVARNIPAWPFLLLAPR